MLSKPIHQQTLMENRLCCWARCTVRRCAKKKKNVFFFLASLHGTNVLRQSQLCRSTLVSCGEAYEEWEGATRLPQATSQNTVALVCLVNSCFQCLGCHCSIETAVFSALEDGCRCSSNMLSSCACFVTTLNNCSCGTAKQTCCTRCNFPAHYLQ